MPYFEAFTVSFKYLFLTLLIPYVILALSLRLYEYHTRSEEQTSQALNRMRFYDDRHNLKIVLTSDSILYITAEENYVNIYYTDNDKVKSYVLRSSMKALDELCQDHGLIRCHRSYYVNPLHVKVLRKDKEGIVYAELDARDMMHIPVTKRYYDRLSEML
jgi:DNA-binding LytR/AlgR family response regulator